MQGVNSNNTKSKTKLKKLKKNERTADIEFGTLTRNHNFPLLLPATLRQFRLQRTRSYTVEMELTLSDNSLKTFARCITCLARIGNELSIQASSSQVTLTYIFNTLTFYFESGFSNHIFITFYISENLAVITYFVAFDFLQLLFHTINSSRSAYQSIHFKPSFFDVYTVSSVPVQCSVLLKVIMVFFLFIILRDFELFLYVKNFLTNIL